VRLGLDKCIAQSSSAMAEGALDQPARQLWKAKGQFIPQPFNSDFMEPLYWPMSSLEHMPGNTEVSVGGLTLYVKESRSRTLARPINMLSLWTSWYPSEHRWPIDVWNLTYGRSKCLQQFEVSERGYLRWFALGESPFAGPHHPATYRKVNVPVSIPFCDFAMAQTEKDKDNDINVATVGLQSLAIGKPLSSSVVDSIVHGRHRKDELGVSENGLQHEVAVLADSYYMEGYLAGVRDAKRGMVRIPCNKSTARMVGEAYRMSKKAVERTIMKFNNKEEYSLLCEKEREAIRKRRDHCKRGF